MTEGGPAETATTEAAETHRLVAWSRELREVHHRLRAALEQAALDRSESPAVLERHLDGIGAIMESHFRYEERQLLAVLETLALDSAPGDVLGPI
ncbi:hemerythrin domain-containing protein [Citricoccus sp. K5]|uniref:hemerythrin domain-containing protein n=1 Tax=Citricoccus sp. K5 TaxID=2653135 RepID=UPI0012F3D9D7|nr:hemerythrin domain-containing protein [Citricoccus sp. K5]VXC01017.1 hypothetical protein CITRIK5_70488 [Citricoccus sp. K5]